jgi:hypothetical protein
MELIVFALLWMIFDLETAVWTFITLAIIPVVLEMITAMVE